jgi:MoaA/NifB/PqqE/SkfB family radical SAM enzyme
MSFPSKASLTITNACNLRCAMCGQWSENGYIRNRAGTEHAASASDDDVVVAYPAARRASMTLPEWKRVVDELADHGVSWVLIRGGEPFLFKGIIELIAHMRDRGLDVAIDTNGTFLADYAADLVALAPLHLTVSVDGPEEIHDAVRGVKGSFARTAEGIRALHAAESAAGRTLSLSACFTISPFSLSGLGVMPDVMRQLGIRTISIVPYYYVPDGVGRRYEAELRALGCRAFSWQGFGHEDSGVEYSDFMRQLDQFRTTLGSVYAYPYLELSDNGYRTWFADATTPIGPIDCWMLDELVDVQPDGEANFCVDYPDYSIGNVHDSSLDVIWNGERAARFREARRRQPFAVCHRCGAKYMAAPGV